MNRQKRTRQLTALTLAAALAIACAIPAAAAPIGDGVTPTYDEAYYATLDYYGNLTEGSVVKSYALNGADSLTDYGTYDEVVNLTDGAAPIQSPGQTSFQFNGNAPSRFYFEGKTAKPFQDLPWTISLHYTLNGVPTKAEDLAGKQGVVEILLDIVPNENAAEYARYNYTLEAMAIFNQDDILSLEAPGAQVQLIGNLRTALFLALPGEEQHFTIRVGSNDFSFGGLTVLMVPATLAQLEEIAKLSQRKDDLEDDYNALSGSLDNLLDALNDIQGGLYASASGLDQLDIARQTFSSGKGVLYENSSRLREDLSNIADIMEPVQERIQILSQTVTDTTGVLNGLADTTLSLQTQLADLESALRGLEDGAGDVKRLIQITSSLEDSLLRLERALGGTHISLGNVSTNSKALVNQVKTVRGAYDTENETEFMQKMLEAQGMGSAQAAAQVKNISQLAAAVESGKIPASSLTSEQQQALATAKQMQALHANKDKMDFQDFCKQLPGVSESQASQMNNLWIIYSGGGSSGSGSGGSTQPSKPTQPSEPGQPAQPSEPTQPDQPDQPGQPENPGQGEQGPADEGGEDKDEGTEPPANTPEAEASTEKASRAAEKKSDGLNQITISSVQNDPEDSGSSDSSGGDSSGSDSSSDDSSGSDSSGDDSSGGDSSSGDSSGDDSSDGDSSGGDSSGDDSSSGDDNPDGDTPGTDNPGTTTPGGSQTVGGAVIDIITSGIDSATSRIDQIQDELIGSLNEIKRPTATVVGNLADVCAQLDTLIPLLDDAENLSSTLRQSTELLRTLLTSVEDLRGIVNSYEPTLQEALSNAGTLSTSAVTTIRDTEKLLADAENLAKATGAPLDDGTKQALRGLSSALRQTAKALGTTRDVQDAKNTITDIIEDTWNEYTGDINNILLMDATADPVSLTDERNPTPSSIQILIRTQEIKAEEPEKNEEASAAKAETTFFGRIAQMFRDLWETVTGIFR